MVCSPNARSLKQAFWEELKESRGLIERPWIVCGNFNAIFALDDELSGAPNL